MTGNFVQLTLFSFSNAEIKSIRYYIQSFSVLKVEFSYFLKTSFQQKSSYISRVTSYTVRRESTYFPIN